MITSYIGFIYSFKNKENSKVYVGQTVNLIKRYKQHIAYSKKEKIVKSPKFYNALRKYGEQGFDFSVIDTIQVEGMEELRNQLTIKEQFWIDYYDSINNGYNTGNAGLAAWTGLKHSDETRRKMSIAGKGRKHSEEHIAKIKASNVGKKRSDAQRLEMSEIKSISVNQYTIDGIFVMTHSSAYAASLYLNVKNHYNIGRCCKGLRETACKFKWAYTNKINIIKQN